MPLDNPTSIAERSGGLSPRALPWIVAAAAVLLGTTGAVHYSGLDLTLSHYDARGHLVVARRIIDSLTPGWRQIGAVWLPVPHVLDLPAVWSDWGYRTGYPAVAISISAMALGLAALSSFLWRTTASRAAALLGPALILPNPNVLYLTSTPMTEPLLLGLSLVSLALVERWLSSNDGRGLHLAGVSIAALTLTRYEGWLVSGALIALAFLLSWRTRRWQAWRLAAYAAGSIIAFLVLGWATTGSWFTTSGFFEPDAATDGDVLASLRQVREGVVRLGGTILLGAGLFGIGASVVLWIRRNTLAVLAVALVAAGCLPTYAFFQGHPHRIRYMVPLVAALGALAAAGVAVLPRKIRPAVAIVLAVAVWYERPAFDAQAPMVLEAQWETPFRRGREAVTAYLLTAHDGTPILASMGSLGHYMQETSRAGFPLATFLHEGNGDLWSAALNAPARHVRWMLIEERAEGGDMLYSRARTDTSYLNGFERVAEGGGMVLYRRRE